MPMHSKNGRSAKPGRQIPKPNLQNVTHLIFDFDGTLVDSFSLHLELFNHLAQKYGHKTLNLAQYQEYRQLSAREFLQTLGVPFYRVPSFLKEGRELLSQRFHELQVFPEVKAALPSLGQNFTLWVLSSTPKPILHAVLEKNSVSQHFSLISSENNLFGKHQALQKILSQASLSTEQAIYIGDEVRDIEACQKVSLPVVAIEWGFNSPERLRRAQPTWQIATVTDLCALLL